MMFAASLTASSTLSAGETRGSDASALKGAIVKNAVYTRRFGSATNAPAVRLAEAREANKVEVMAASYHHGHPYYASYRGWYGGWGYRPYYYAAYRPYFYGGYRPYYYGYRPYCAYRPYYAGCYRPSYAVGIGYASPYWACARPPIYSYSYSYVYPVCNAYSLPQQVYGNWHSSHYAPSYGASCYRW